MGAIATDIPNQGVGASVNQLSEDLAKQAAIVSCVSNGGIHCKIDITYANSCVAIVAGNAGDNTDRASTIDKAVQMGMKTCVSSGDTNCHARYASCSMAQWVQ